MTGRPLEYVVEPIGVVRSSLGDVLEAPRQAGGAPQAALEIDPRFAEALHRIVPGDDLVLLTWLHLAGRSVLQTRPMGDLAIR